MASKGYSQLIDQVNEMLNTDKIMFATLSTVFAQHKQRIFEKGNDANDSTIGQYSTTPISVSKKNQARQTGKTYFKGGYREYKSLSGKGSRVNLRNTDQMMMDYGLDRNGVGSYVFGFSNQFNFDKSEWNEEHFDKEIFAQSPSEESTFEKVFQFELNKI